METEAKPMPVSVLYVVTFQLGKESDQFATPKPGGIRLEDGLQEPSNRGPPWLSATFAMQQYRVFSDLAGNRPILFGAMS